MQTIKHMRARYTPEEIAELANQLLADGFCILRGHFDTNKLAAWKAAFLELLARRVSEGTASARGPNRYYVSLPFTAPFADPDIYENPDVIGILSKVTDGDLVMPELASDTPSLGSEYQVVHRDFPQRSPDLPDLDPRLPFQFAVNFPLCDVTLENGPVEVAPGTHAITDEAAKELIESGEVESRLIPILLNVGDVMIRDVRGLHRGTPNKTNDPRPMIVVGYNRSAHRRPQLRIYIPRKESNQLSDLGKQLLRLNPVVETLEQAPNREDYSNLYFLEQD